MPHHTSDHACLSTGFESLTCPNRRRPQDFGKVEDLMDHFRCILRESPDIEAGLPSFVGIKSLENHSLNILLHVSTPPARRPGIS